MDLAANKEITFKYQSEDHHLFGKFIVKIGDHTQEPAQNKYWMLYILPKFPDILSKPQPEFLSQKGVSSLEIEDQKHYLFWLKTVIY